MRMSLSMDSLPEPTQCQGQRDRYVRGSFWWLWSLTGELVDGFAVSITQSCFKGNLKRAEALLASHFMTGRCWCGLKWDGYVHLFIQTFMSHLSRQGGEQCRPSTILFLIKQLSQTTRVQVGFSKAFWEMHPGSDYGVYFSWWYRGLMVWCRDLIELLFQSIHNCLKWSCSFIQNPHNQSLCRMLTFVHPVST